MEPGRAVALLQAGFRGRHWRRRWAACVQGVTRLQARQRAVFTRREFEALRRLQREQRERQREAEGRQRRIDRGEQTLAFLRRTSPEELARLERLQQRRGARRIQRAWRAGRPGDGRRRVQDVADPKERVWAFDPLAGGLKREEEETETLLGPLPSAADGLGLDADADELAKRRRDVHDRVKRMVRELKAREASQRALEVDAAPSSDKKTRRELCETLSQLRTLSARRIARHAGSYRATQPDKQVQRAQLLASCSNRLERLLAEQPPALDALDGAGADVFAAVERLSDARKRAAWRQHRGVIAHALDKQHWWQTRLAGHERDIRTAVVRGPWESGRQLWAWPPRPDADHEPTDPETETGTETEEIRAFLFGEAGGELMADDEASAWWRAHCTQSHLSFLDSQSPGSKWTVETVANEQLWQLMERVKRRRKAESMARELEMHADRQDELVARRVAKIEGSMLANTQLKEELATREQRRQERQSRAQQAAVSIQRHVRGLLGRNRAKEVRAEFFVTVRGRAIRKGRCEECGEQRAVLECGECQDSSRFCPVCWVHVHSTRRRRTHAALPIAEPLPLPKPKVAKAVESGGARARPTSRAVKGAAKAAERPAGVDIPSLALSEVRSQRLDCGGRTKSVGGERKAVARVEDRLGASGERTELVPTEHPAEQQPTLLTTLPTEQPVEQRLTLSSEDTAGVSEEDMKANGAEADVTTESPAAAAAAAAAASGPSPRPTTTASTSTAERDETAAPEVDGKVEARRPPAVVRKVSSRGLNEKKRPAAKPNTTRSSLRDRMKAAEADVAVSVSVAPAEQSGEDSSVPASASEAPTVDGTLGVVGAKIEVRPSESEQLDESVDRGGGDEAAGSLPVDVDVDGAKEGGRDASRELDGASASGAAEQTQSRQGEQGSGDDLVDEEVAPHRVSIE